MEEDTAIERSSGWWWWWPSWRPTSESLLRKTEAKILACVQSDLWARFVTLPTQDKIWTLTVTKKGSNNKSGTASHTPLVLVHGFGGGVGLWIRNLDSLCRSRPVHTFDVLGFARSSRPQFPSDAAQAEQLWVQSIEQWRQEMGLERVVLLGHSLGGYLATSYAIQYPERVTHLILADPWGFPERPQPGSEMSVEKRPQIPRWVKALASIASLFNPLAAIRAAGPWGPGLVNRFRPDFKKKFEDLFDDDTMTEYIYHCNAQNPSGEVGFRSMSESLGWAKRPMLQRVHQLPTALPVTLLYGARSWVDSNSGTLMEKLRPRGSTCTVMINDASHHVYADQPEEFNRVVERICASTEL